jgi:hypothetical protein
VANFRNSNNWEYIFKYHRAKINVDGTGKNALSATKKSANILEAAIEGHMGIGELLVNLRYSSEDISANGRNGSLTSAGVSWTLNY